MNSRELKRKIRSIQAFERSIQPDEAWVSRTRETLLMQVKNSMSTQPVPVRRQANELYQRLFPPAWRTALRGPAFAAFAVVAAMFGVSLAGVSAAEKALPGDLFYPVKIASEQARLLLTKTKTEKLIVKAELVERRAQEIKQIAVLDGPEKDKRIQEASETLRRDLDTVKKQLNDVNDENAAGEQEGVIDVVQAVKVVDKKSEEVVNVLKDAKAGLTGETKESVEKVETAAVTTGVKAVQVLIESKDHPEVQDVLKPEELTQSIQVKVDGIQEKLVVAKEKAEVAVQLSASTTAPNPSTADASKAANALTQLQTAQTNLEEAKKFLTENKLDEVKDKLGEASKAVTNAENASGSILVQQKDDAPIQSMTSTTASTTNPSLATSSTAETATSTASTASSTTSVAPSSTSTTR